MQAKKWVIGLTGGIGTGKTTAANMFEALGVPIYIADKEAKKLLESHLETQKAVTDIFGKHLYSQGGLNREKLASIVFNNPQKLSELNSIVHPQVQRHFNLWKQKQSGEYIIKEAAILLESGSYKDCDKIIVVTAPKNIRIERVMQRDHIDENTVRERMQNQWTEDKKILKADFVITNDKGIDHLKEQVERVHKKILEIFA